jgi:cytochrome c oxidase assembly protein subunit 15
MNDSQTPTLAASRLPHRLATVLVCAVFPLIFVGGLVTTTEAGMAVPDWPNTYGYNLFLYPLSTWFAGPWDIFVEHGHRLLGAAAGFLTIALAWSLWRHDERRWMKGLGLAALAAVIAQGVLGGLRVVLDARLLAMIHGCTGPLYFALCVALWQFTALAPAVAATNDPHAAKAFRLTLLTTCLAYFQLVLGAVVRHIPVDAAPATFRTAVLFHLFMAAVVTIHVVLAVAAILKVRQSQASLRPAAVFLGSLLLVQLALGLGTWIVNYGFPQWVNAVVTTPNFVIRSTSLPQVLITTSHVAVGSLIVVTSLVLTLRTRLLVRPVAAAASASLGLFLREAVT